MNNQKTNCLFCWYARPRKDVCFGVYCVGECQKNKDGTCGSFEDYREHRKKAAAQRKAKKAAAGEANQK